MTPSQAVDALGHRFVSVLDIGGGPDLACARCGVRQHDPLARNLCQPAPKVPGRVVSDYDPHAGA